MTSVAIGNPKSPAVIENGGESQRLDTTTAQPAPAGAAQQAERPVQRMEGWSDTQYIAELENVVRLLRRDLEKLHRVREALADCSAGQPCSTCPDKKKCQRGCIRQEEFISTEYHARQRSLASRWQAPAQQGVQWQCGPQASGFTAPRPTQAQAGAVPPEAEPIVLNCEAPGDLKPGDYVFASRWSDCDPGDPWEVGFVSEVGVYPESMTKAGYVVLQGGSRRWGRAMRITPEQGLRICEQFPSMEQLPQDYDAIARVFGIKGGQHADR